MKKENRKKLDIGAIIILTLWVMSLDFSKLTAMHKTGLVLYAALLVITTVNMYLSKKKEVK